jgi:hypothetical protein
VALLAAGDWVQFELMIQNTGTSNAKIDSIVVDLDPVVGDNPITVTGDFITGLNAAQIAAGQFAPLGIYELRVNWAPGVNTAFNGNATFTITVNYSID